MVHFAHYQLMNLRITLIIINFQKLAKKSDWFASLLFTYHLQLKTSKNFSVIQQDKETDSTETDDETSENEDYVDADVSSDDEVLTVGLESENDDEIMIPETVYTRSGRKAGGFSTVSDLF